VVIIVAFNIFGSLQMLMIEKREDIGTLSALGAGDGTIKRIFVLEGWMISLLGMAVGLVAGIALALLQQHFGLVKIPGNYIVDAYPVVLKAGDVLLTAAAVAAVGFVVALAPVAGRELKTEK
jgi:ABC-type lipoprotein release transport system permease subunit